MVNDTTFAALDNLCTMLGIGGTWDEKIFELARRAFMAKAKYDEATEERRLHPERARVQLMVKKDTEADLLTLYEKLYPFQDFVGWNKYLAELAELVHDNMGSLVMRE